MLYSQRHLEKEKANYRQNWIYTDLLKCIENNNLNKIHEVYIKTLYLNQTEEKKESHKLYSINYELEKILFEEKEEVNKGDYEIIKRYTAIKLNELLNSLNRRKIKNSLRFIEVK